MTPPQTAKTEKESSAVRKNRLSIIQLTPFALAGMLFFALSTQAEEQRKQAGVEQRQLVAFLAGQGQKKPASMRTRAFS